MGVGESKYGDHEKDIDEGHHEDVAKFLDRPNAEATHSAVYSDPFAQKHSSNQTEWALKKMKANTPNPAAPPRIKTGATAGDIGHEDPKGRTQLRNFASDGELISSQNPVSPGVTPNAF